MSREVNPSEIQAQMRRKYLERLESRLKHLRRCAVERDWTSFRNELVQLKSSAASFGFPGIVDLADNVLDLLPQGSLSRAYSFHEAQPQLDSLFSTIDTILIRDKVISLP